MTGLCIALAEDAAERNAEFYDTFTQDLHFLLLDL